MRATTGVGAGRRPDHDVGVLEGLRQPGPRYGAAADPRREILGPLGRAVDDPDVGDPGLDGLLGEERARVASPDDEERPLGHVPEDFRRELVSDRGDRERVLRDLRFRADALAGGESALEHAVRHGPGRSGLAGETERRPDLPQDLALPEGHRVEPRGDAEEVARGLRSLPEEAGADDLGRVEPPPPRDQGRDLLVRVLAVGQRVDLAPVAGRDDDALARQPLSADALEGFADLVGREGDALADRDVGAAEVPAEQQQAGFGGAHRNRCDWLKTMLTTVYEKRTRPKPRIDSIATRGPSQPRRSIQRSRP